jgi:hypothetical protein
MADPFPALGRGLERSKMDIGFAAGELKWT